MELQGLDIQDSLFLRARLIPPPRTGGGYLPFGFEIAQCEGTSPYGSQGLSLHLVLRPGPLVA